MDQVKGVLDSLLDLLIRLGDVIVGVILAIELWLSDKLGAMGIPPLLQTVVLVGFAAMLVLAALRLFGGLIRIAVILVLALIALHVLMPVMHA